VGCSGGACVIGPFYRCWILNTRLVSGVATV